MIIIFCCHSQLFPLSDVLYSVPELYSLNLALCFTSVFSNYSWDHSHNKIFQSVSWPILMQKSEKKKHNIYRGNVLVAILVHWIAGSPFTNCTADSKTVCDSSDMVWYFILGDLRTRKSRTFQKMVFLAKKRVNKLRGLN